MNLEKIISKHYPFIRTVSRVAFVSLLCLADEKIADGKFLRRLGYFQIPPLKNEQKIDLFFGKIA